MAKGSGSSYQPLRHWQSHASGKWADVDFCWLGRNDGGVLSKEEGNGGVLPKLREKASRSEELRSERKLISMYIGVDQG